jgi:DNA-binding HxlR family transcriptional regulator
MGVHQIRASSGSISQRMLTLTLKALEEDGLVTRTVFPIVPPRVDYELTDLGRSLLVPISALYEWTKEHHVHLLAARKAFQESR